VHTSKQAVRELLRVAWRTVGRIVARVGADAERAVDRLDGLARIGIDESSHRKGQRYLTVIVDHDSGRLVWAAPGHHAATLGRFFDLLGEERCAAIRLVSADAAEWIARVVAACCPQARLCLDPFHVARVGHRRARRGPPGGVERRPHGRGHGAGPRAQGARFALWKNPEDLTARQRAKLAWIARVNDRRYRAWLLEEERRLVFKLKGVRATVLLQAWLGWARRCRIPAFVRLARSISQHRAGIQAALTEGLSNGLVRGQPEYERNRQ
jgi:transposase